MQTAQRTPRLKSVVWLREGAQLRLLYDIRDQFVLDDPDGAIEALLELLAEGGRTPHELALALSDGEQTIEAADVEEALGLLDSCGLVESAHESPVFAADEQERYFSNLAFFESFASLARGREDFQQDLRDAHVLVLGTGGLNSNTIPHLCGLGVGRLTLLDRDLVEPRNFARQYLYRQEDIGAVKVERAAEWVRAFDPGIKVEAVTADLSGAEQLDDLLSQLAPDVVMSGVDSPSGIDGVVNAACVARRVPWVRGGMFVTTGIVYSVDPGRSACWGCRELALQRLSPEERAASDLFGRKDRTNRGIGPVAGLLGSLCAFEVLRYLTGFEPPAHAGQPLSIDFAGGCRMTDLSWERDSDCPVCGSISEPDVRGGGDRP